MVSIIIPEQEQFRELQDDCNCRRCCRVVALMRNDAPAKLAFGKLHGRLVMDPPQQHGVEVYGQVHGHAHAPRVGKVLKVHMPHAIALGSHTEFLEFTLYCTGHLDLSCGGEAQDPVWSKYSNVAFSKAFHPALALSQWCEQSTIFMGDARALPLEMLGWRQQFPLTICKSPIRPQ